MAKETYKCAECKGVFEKGRTDEESRKEAENNFGKELLSQGEVVICDDCYNKYIVPGLN